MKKGFFTGRKLFGTAAVLLLFGIVALGFSAGSASAAPSSSSGPSVSECSQTSNPSACKQAFQNCDNQKNETPSLCKSIYLEQQAQLGSQKAPAESECNSTSNPSACKSAYEKCGSSDNTCKQNAISNQLKQDVNSAGSGAQTEPNGTFNTGDNTSHHDVCGSGSDAVNVSINIGCKGQGNPIMDMLFAIIRILSDGVGLVVVGSIIVGGIQYTASRGDPQSTAMAVNRIRSSVFALIIFIFGYAILNFIIPQGFFQ
ncbi:MAG TPA: hypothetical protein VHC21_00800 [Candidatus Saccharimonadales bacterium]|nr:hypothetical protein [Candidatus Saccharimonadales bacterium]